MELKDQVTSMKSKKTKFKEAHPRLKLLTVFILKCRIANGPTLFIRLTTIRLKKILQTWKPYFHRKKEAWWRDTNLAYSETILLSLQTLTKIMRILIKRMGLSNLKRNQKNRMKRCFKMLTITLFKRNHLPWSITISHCSLTKQSLFFLSRLN